MVRRFTWSLLLSIAALAQSGVPPRPAPTEYPVHEAAAGTTVAARVLTPDQIRKVLPPDVARAGYLVVEVALYPEAGKPIDVYAADFLLRVGPNSETLPAGTGADVADALVKHGYAQRPKDVTVSSTTDVGYGSGNDPVTGRREHTVYTGTGVGVGIGSPGPPSPDPAASNRYRDAIRHALESKALPEGTATSAVAGYLYFPKLRGKAAAASLELDYYGTADQIKLRLP